MNEDKLRPLTLEPVDGALTAMDGTVVDDPEDPVSGAIRGSCHHLGNQRIKGGDGGFVGHVSKEAGSMDIPRSLIGTGSMASILVLNAHRTPSAGRLGGMSPLTDLELCFLVS